MVFSMIFGTAIAIANPCAPSRGISIIDKVTIKRVFIKRMFLLTDPDPTISKTVPAGPVNAFTTLLIRRISSTLLELMYSFPNKFNKKSLENQVIKKMIPVRLATIREFCFNIFPQYCSFEA